MGLFFNHYKILNKGFSEKFVNLTTKGFLSQQKITYRKSLAGSPEQASGFKDPGLFSL
jgi:hypothetical protein